MENGDKFMKLLADMDKMGMDDDLSRLVSEAREDDEQELTMEELELVTAAARKPDYSKFIKMVESLNSKGGDR